MEENLQRAQEEVFVASLDRYIRFHRKWKRITMSSYVFTTIGALAFSAAATIIGALDIGKVASVLAGATTLLIVIENTLLFREKWKLHLLVETRLENIRLNFHTNQLDVQKAIERVTQIIEEYSVELPIEERRARETTLINSTF